MSGEEKYDKKAVNMLVSEYCVAIHSQFTNYRALYQYAKINWADEWDNITNDTALQRARSAIICYVAFGGKAGTPPDPFIAGLTAFALRPFIAKLRDDLPVPTETWPDEFNIFPQ